MFGAWRRWRIGPVLSDGNILMRAPQGRDFRNWAAARAESRNFLQRWEPRWAPDELSLRAWRGRVVHAQRERRQGSGHNFLIFPVDQSVVFGGISVFNIRRGVSRSGQIGYWMSVDHAGKGHMSAALTLLVDYAFGELKLHRIEAACIPGNERSIRLLENAGFQREGLLKSYLQIDGKWQDHFLYALIEDMGKSPAGEKA